MRILTICDCIIRPPSCSARLNAPMSQCAASAHQHWNSPYCELSWDSLARPVRPLMPVCVVTANIPSASPPLTSCIHFTSNGCARPAVAKSTATPLYAPGSSASGPSNTSTCIAYHAANHISYVYQHVSSQASDRVMLTPICTSALLCMQSACCTPADCMLAPCSGW